MKVAIGMSGGIDSTIAAYLLSRQGYRVIGIHLRTWDSRDEGECSNDQDWKDVQESCYKLGIPCKSINYTREYWTMVFTPFIKQLSLAASPNPDVNCNSKIKFGKFYQYCINHENADYVASGHYARIINGQLYKGIDVKKDQSYYLSTLNQLGKIKFPLGNMTKEGVKRIAKSIGMEKLIQRKESTGICFIGKRNFTDFIQEYIVPDQGDFVNENGSILASHKGLQCYTLGQKAKIPGSSTKLYVADKDPKTNRILVVAKNHPLLYTKSIIFNPFWMSSIRGRITVKHRYRMSPVPASVLQEKDYYRLVFDEPQSSVAPGQHVTMYNNDLVLGGGEILGQFPLSDF